MISVMLYKVFLLLAVAQTLWCSYCVYALTTPPTTTQTIRVSNHRPILGKSLFVFDSTRFCRKSRYCSRSSSRDLSCCWLSKPKDESLDDDEEKENEKRNKQDKNQSFRPKKLSEMENKDLPFKVKVLIPPDDYSNIMTTTTQTTTNTENKKKTTKKKNGKTKTKKSTKEEDKLTQVLGEFYFDRVTGCGDIIEIDEKQYKVKTASWQYKYEGPVKKFVKIGQVLKVKPLDRAVQEEYIMRQWSLS